MIAKSVDIQIYKVRKYTNIYSYICLKCAQFPKINAGNSLGVYSL